MTTQTLKPPGPVSTSHSDALAVTGVSKTYSKGEAVRALDDVSVAFERGRFTAIMGPSGSGKSTLLHVAAGRDAIDNDQALGHRFTGQHRFVDH